MSLNDSGFPKPERIAQARAHAARVRRRTRTAALFLGGAVAAALAAVVLARDAPVFSREVRAVAVTLTLLAAILLLVSSRWRKLSGPREGSGLWISFALLEAVAWIGAVVARLTGDPRHGFLLAAAGAVGMVLRWPRAVPSNFD